MDKIKLSNNTVFEIEDGASLANIVHNAKTATKAREAAAEFTAANLAHVEFLHEDMVNGIYNNLALTPTDEGAENPAVDGKKVTISLCQ